MRAMRTGMLGLATVALVLSPAVSALAQSEEVADDSPQAVLDWNVNTLQAAGASGIAPAVVNLHLAMVHGAVHDAVNAISGRYAPYLGALEAAPDASMTAAAATAAHDVLVVAFPEQAAELDARLEASLAAVPEGEAREAGVAVGQAAAAAMVAAREGDGRGAAYPLTFGEGPGEYRPTPPDFGEFGAAWIAGVKPFVAESTEVYRTAGPYTLDSAEYAADLNEVKAVGAAEGSTRTPEQEALLGFWLTPIGQWSAVERSLALREGLDIADAARLFAIAGLASGDAASACHADKYTWMLWRPITAIAEAASDGNDATEADPDWAPLVVTPPYPEHPSGWNCYAGAHVGALREFFGSDELAYQIANPETGETRDYTTLSEGLQEGIDLRIYQGIHFRHGDEAGAELGLQAAKLAAERLAPAS